MVDYNNLKHNNSSRIVHNMFVVYTEKRNLIKTVFYLRILFSALVQYLSKYYQTQ